MKTKHPIIIGIDTHKATHVAVAIDTQGARLAALSIPANTKGYLELERWSCGLGSVQAFGIEGTGSYGAGLSRSLYRAKNISLLRSRVQTASCAIRTERLTALMQKAQPDRSWQGKQLPAPKPKRGRQK